MIMEDVQFCVLLAQLDERYQVPGRTVINHEMDKLKIELKGKFITCTCRYHAPRVVSVICRYVG